MHTGGLKSWSMLCKNKECLVGMMKWVRLMVVTMVWEIS